MTKGAYIGPFQRIVNVGWNTRTEIATLQWNSDFVTSLSSRAFAASVSFPQLGFAQDLFLALPTVVAPPGIITPSLRGKSFWEYPTVKTDSSFDTGGGTITIVDRGIYYVQTERGIVTSLTKGPSQDIYTLQDGSTIRFADASGVGPDTFVPFLWDHTGDSSGGALLDAAVNVILINMADELGLRTFPTPVLHSIVNSHDEAVSSVVHNEEFRRAFMFLNMTHIKALLPHESTFRIIIETGNSISATHESLSWQATVATWKNRLAFPVTPAPDYSPLYGFPISFAPPPFPDGSLTLVAGGEAVVPAATVEFDIDLTNYNVTGSRVDH